MKPTYNRFAAQSLDRVATLSDSIFAVSMTLLVLNLHVPEIKSIHSEGALLHAVGKMAPNLLTYLMSFLTLGIFWVSQQTQLNHFTRSNRDLTWIHIAFLSLVTLMPFSTALLAAFTSYRIALVIYWFNILLLGVMLLSSWQYARHEGLLKADTPEEMKTATVRRIAIAQSLYACGALLCVVNTYISIVIIILVQLNYVIAPRIRHLNEI